ncbi:MAG: nitrite reductase small subunit NirD [Phycisphaerae bacterium]|nr:nitrite reductase small subunit NirD [Saprospiraceae bacterium]
MVKTSTEKFVAVGTVDDFPRNGGACVLVDGEQIAVFNFDHKDWYAVQNRCPHEKQMVLSRGLIGDAKGEPKVACPLHKNQFSLVDGHHLGGNPEFQLKKWNVRVIDNTVQVGAKAIN